MSKRTDTEHREVRALADAAWLLKESAEALNARAMTAETRTVLASATRDVERIKARVLGELERRVSVRKRDKAADVPPDALEPVPQGLLDVGGNDHG